LRVIASTKIFDFLRTAPAVYASEFSTSSSSLVNASTVDAVGLRLLMSSITPTLRPR
jgi:hypothetical protein